jgi:hypothetical protein
MPYQRAITPAGRNSGATPRHTRRPSLPLSALCLAGLLASAAFAGAPLPSGSARCPADAAGGEPIRDELSAEQEEAMWAEIRASVAALRSAHLLPAPDAALTVTYNFPLRLVSGLPDYAGFRVSAFVDHNPVVGVLDYNGGARTYDSHRGTDLALWPFGWNKVDAGEMQVVAAAAGTIVNKSDTDATDHNPCDGGSNSDPWNYIAVTHADGRLTIYGHMRHNSLTSKVIGQTVVQGEYLGTAASSGSSSGPHLHFEVRYGSFSNSEWIDPYSGPNSQPESLWTGQRPYFDSAINRVATHSSPPSTPDSCALTTTNLQDSFTVAQNIYFYAYYRDYQGALPTELSIYRPDGSVYDAWQYTTATTFSSAWTGSWVRNLPAGSPSGTWRFAAVYNGQTFQTYFNVSAPPAITVAAPNGGEQWDRLQPHSVTWADNLGGEVNLALYQNNVFSTLIASNTPSDGTYLWTPGAGLATGSGYSMRVTSVTGPALFDASNAPFTLTTALLFSSGFETGTAGEWSVSGP